MRSALGPLLLVLLLSGVPTSSSAVVTSLPASRDNTLYEDLTGSLSNGAGDNFFAGRTTAGDIRRGVIAFDVAAAIPVGATINSTTLTLNMSRTIAGPTPVGLHPLLAGWGEAGSHAGGQEGSGAPALPGDATWIHTFFPGSFWAAPGGSFAVGSSATTVVAGLGIYVWGATAAMVGDVQSWLDTPAGNFGWAVIGDEIALGTAKRFDTLSNPSVSLRPVLTKARTRAASSTRWRRSRWAVGSSSSNTCGSCANARAHSTS